MSDEPLELSDSERLYLAITQSLYQNFKPFPGQVRLGKAVFDDVARLIFVRCGRGWGKSMCAAWIASKFALENPKSLVYLYAPLLKDAKEIYWFPERLQDFIDPQFIKRVDNQDFSIFLNNKSRIKIDGSENARRGLLPDLVIADEYADFDEAWAPAMLPNLGKTQGQALFLGTPPEFPRLIHGDDHHYVEMKNQVEVQAKQHPGKAFHIHAPTWDNPHYDKEFLEDEKARLKRLGQEYVYHREYGAEIVDGSRLQIFPMFKPSEHVVRHEDMMSELSRDPDRYDWIVSADPATKSVFAVVFMAIDNYTATPYWIDEIYEEDPSKTTTNQIVPRIRKKCEELNGKIENWALLSDIAAQSFIESAYYSYDTIFYGVPKQSGDRSEWLPVLADIFDRRKGIMSDRCERTALEVINYSRDERGRPVKRHDHCIDASRYALKDAGFTFEGIDPNYTPRNPIEGERMVTLEEDIEHLFNQEDWTRGIG